MDQPIYSIATVERETGLSKDVLRMWERRYGFPAPQRDANGERIYPGEQVARLRLVKRLLDQGHRPGKLVAMSLGDLSSLAPRRERPSDQASDESAGEHLEGLLALIKQHEGDSYMRALQQQLVRHGLQRFVQNIVAPLTRRAGEAWEDGTFEVFEEHLFTELTTRVLRQAISVLPKGIGTPRVLLTSVPDEPHALGLLMVESLLVLEGAECISLGTQMPLLEIARAAEAHRVDIVALSFSSAFPLRQIPPLLGQLRQTLAEPIQIWVGGSGVLRVAETTGVLTFSSLAQCVLALAEWREKRARSLNPSEV